MHSSSLERRPLAPSTPRLGLRLGLGRTRWSFPSVALPTLFVLLVLLYILLLVLVFACSLDVSHAQTAEQMSVFRVVSLAATKEQQHQEHDPVPPMNLTVQSNKHSADFTAKVRAGLKVPHILHRTSKNFTDLPPLLRSFHEECKEIYHADDWEVREWNDDDIHAFVRDTFPEHYQRFCEMQPAIRRIDAVRYLWMYEYGGIYLDMDAECVRNASQLVDALPEGRTAWSGGYPEPFFLMSTAGNNFWLYAFQNILNHWRVQNVRGTGGPQGLNRMCMQYTKDYGLDAVRLFALNDVKAAESVYPPGDVLPFDATWRWFVSRDEFQTNHSNMTIIPPVEHKIGFLPNLIVDPTACLSKIKGCRESHCHERQEPKIQQALFVHHCLQSWGGEGVAKKQAQAIQASHHQTNTTDPHNKS